MRRFSIARLMLVVAFLAANLGVIRFLLSPSREPLPSTEILIGVVPLMDALLLSAFILLSRHRLRVRRRSKEETGRFSVAFLAVGTSLLLLLLIFGFWGRDSLNDLLRWFAVPTERLLASTGVNLNEDTPIMRYVADPMFLGGVVSGPPLLLSLGLAFALSRLKLVITPRAGAPCEVPASSH